MQLGYSAIRLSCDSIQPARHPKQTAIRSLMDLVRLALIQLEALKLIRTVLSDICHRYRGSPPVRSLFAAERGRNPMKKARVTF